MQVQAFAYQSSASLPSLRTDHRSRGSRGEQREEFRKTSWKRGVWVDDNGRGGMLLPCSRPLSPTLLSSEAVTCTQEIPPLTYSGPLVLIGILLISLIVSSKCLFPEGTVTSLTEGGGWWREQPPSG